MENNWYVYRHIRLDKNEPFYIGIGKTKDYKRAYEKYKCDRSNIWFNITNKTEYKVEIVLDSLTKDEASDIEKYLIKYYGRIDLNTGILCNLTDGGDGCWSRVWTDEQRKIQSENMKGSKNHMFGKKQSQETISKRAEKLKGFKFSDEAIENMKIAASERGESKETTVYDFKTMSVIGTFPSLSEACRYIGLNKNERCKASLVARGKRNRVKEYSFSFTNFEKEVKTKKKRNINPDNKLLKTILNIETGIYYRGIEEANNSLTIPISKLSMKLSGARKNNTNFIYV